MYVVELYVWDVKRNQRTPSHYLNPLRAKFSRENKNINLHLMSFLHIDMAQVVEILSHIRKELTYSTCQYHGFWCPGNTRSQGISYHDIYYVVPELIRSPHIEG